LIFGEDRWSGFFVVTNLQDKKINKIKSFNKEDWSSAYQNVEKELTKEPLKISKKKNENVTGSILIWATIILIPIVSIIEQPWNVSPRLDSTISVIYLGLVSTGVAWLLRFKILKKNGLIFQSQVSYLIPIFGIILSYIFLKEIIIMLVQHVVTVNSGQI